MDQKLEMLATVPLLAGLDRRDLEAVGALCDELDLPAGKVIAAQGAHGDAFYVIVDGTVAIDRDGTRLRELGPGDFFGELAMLAPITRTATATTTSAGRLLVIGHREFHDLLGRFPSIQTSVLKALAARLVATEPGHAH